MADEEGQGKNPYSGLWDAAVDGMEGVFETTNGNMRGIPISHVANAMFGANKNINVTLDWPWVEPHILTRAERKVIPSIYMREFEISENGLHSTVQYYQLQKQENRKGMNANPYRGLYCGRKTGMMFTFPYISNFAGGLTTEWNEAQDMAERTGMPTDKLGMFGEAAGQISEAATSIGKMGMVLNSAMNQMKDKNKVMILNPVIPKVWKGTQGEEINVVFYLFNTNASPSTWINNWKLITYLKMAVTFNQLNCMFAAPPSIYTVTVPSIIHMSSAYISTYKVEQCGNCILYPLGGSSANEWSESGAEESHWWQTLWGHTSSNAEESGDMEKAAARGQGPKNALVVPDAWKLTIKITELVPQSRQMIFNGLLKMGQFGNVSSITGAHNENPEPIVAPTFPSGIDGNGGGAESTDSGLSQDQQDAFDGSGRVNAEEG